MNHAANFWHKLYKSNFYNRSNETQRLFEEAMAEFLKEYEEERNKR